ncbi:DUF3558 domain-containing protein [Streptomyces sp. SID4985]|uniref:DUF3558 domain-containing protein n=1 Tax=Streptomyces sp. SID4985 TaxID=2690292 RepID=UPI001370A295|nr:DUF3558 domain-containing protein [Streptomyces sp. SID4985]
MQRKAHVIGTAALFAALLTGCTSGSDGASPTDDANPGDAGAATVAAQPGKYRTLPEPCGAVGRETLAALLPGVRQITDPDQRDKAYRGVPELTYDTDRKVGCHWKVESTTATDRLSVDFERVVSFDNAVSDDSEARELFQGMEKAAHLPVPGTPGGEPASPSGSPSGTASPTPTASTSTSTGPGASPDPSDTDTDAVDLRPRALPDLGDEAYLDDQLATSGSTAEPRTVTVVFRTSNVVVTLEYEEQPMVVGAVPDSKEMQDRARDLASQLADKLNG